MRYEATPVSESQEEDIDDPSAETEKPSLSSTPFGGDDRNDGPSYRSSVSIADNSRNGSKLSSSFMRPQECIPLPKAKAQKTVGQRKKGESAIIITNTPDMKIIEEAAARETVIAKAKENLFDRYFETCEKVKKTPQLHSTAESSEESSQDEIPASESDPESFEPLKEETDSEDITAGQFFLVQFNRELDDSAKQYVGELTDFNEEQDTYYLFYGLSLES